LSRADFYPEWTGLLKGRRLVLVVTGGVAAYKAAELARLYLKAGAVVRVAMTEAAARFVTPLTFESLTGQPAVWDMWSRPQPEIGHVAWAEWAEAMIAAPATADFLAKMACGLADDFASALILAFEGPKLLAPAMNTGMYLNQATQANIGLLAQRGMTVLVPPCGPLASGRVGPGRLPHPKVILRQTARMLAPKPLEGRSFLVTAGATQESWDDIRILTNRSSGLMGLSLARAAWLMGAGVLLIAGPSLANPMWCGEDFLFKTAETTEDMLMEVQKAWPDYDSLIMNAAPADFKPVKVSGKIKKDDFLSCPLVLERTPDILKSLRSGTKDRSKTVIGFAAEDEDLALRAWEKLKDKDLDFIVANQAGGTASAFASPEIHVFLLAKDGRETEIGPGPKFGVAWEILENVAGVSG
jgi:phosphopantothenoylcysteine decarboxylase/phosphopantothenate--cysteine ligase